MNLKDLAGYVLYSTLLCCVGKMRYYSCCWPQVIFRRVKEEQGTGRGESGDGWGEREERWGGYRGEVQTKISQLPLVLYE